MKKINIDDKVGRTMKCMMIGSSFYNVALLIIVIISTIIYCKINDVANADTITCLVKNILVLLIGYTYSIFAIYSMTVSITKSVDANDDAFAKRHMVISSLVRLAAFVIILIIIINEKYFGVVGSIIFLLASLGVKAGAYLTPLLERKL
jgi:hypothetical protein